MELDEILAMNLVRCGRGAGCARSSASNLLKGGMLCGEFEFAFPRSKVSRGDRSGIQERCRTVTILI